MQGFPEKVNELTTKLHDRYLDEGETYLVISESYSDFQQLKRQSYDQVIEQLKIWFSLYEVPEEEKEEQEKIVDENFLL